MRKLSAFLRLTLLLPGSAIAQENKVSVKKSGNNYMLETNGKTSSLFNTEYNKLLV